MPKRKTEDHRDPEAFEQEDDGRGRIRLDRPLTGAEAQAVDEANRQAAAQERAARFEGRG